ncbi:MAG: bifunctional oligoribonuclease/PAP phosphatase NrnA [Phycisphaerales bacterium]
MTDSPRTAEFTYAGNADWSDLAARFRAADHVVLVTHRKPDGDAIGSLVGVARILESVVDRVDMLIVGPMDPALLEAAGGVGAATLTMVEGGAPEGLDPDLVCVCDTGAWSQLEPLGPWLRERRDRVIGIDHHASGDDVAVARIVDTAAASTTQMIVHLADALDVPLDAAIATPLYLGLATDTGWFRFSNADAACYRVAAQLLAAGVEKDRLYQMVEETHRPARLALSGRALSGLQYAAGGAVAVQSLGPADFAAARGGTEDLVGLVNVPMSVSQIRASVFATESEPGMTKISFRGKPGASGRPDADVNELASTFGGGGHRFAAGARIPEPLETAMPKIVAAVDAWATAAGLVPEAVSG